MKSFVGMVLVLFLTIGCSAAPTEAPQTPASSLPATIASPDPTRSPDSDSHLSESTICRDGKGNTIPRVIPPLPPGYSCDSQFELPTGEELFVTEYDDRVNAVVWNHTKVSDSKAVRRGSFTIGKDIYVDTSGETIKIGIGAPIPTPTATVPKIIKPSEPAAGATAPDLVLSKPIPPGFRITLAADAQDQKIVFIPTAGRNFYVLVSGTPPNSLTTGKPLRLRPEYVVQQLTEWGFHPSYNYELHIFWDDRATHLKTGLCGMFGDYSWACSTAMTMNGGFLFRLRSEGNPLLYADPEPFHSLEDYYSAMLNFEMYRVILKEIQHTDWTTESPNSEIYKKYGWTPSKYQYFESK